MVTLTVDGVKVSVKKGSSILEAAQAAGVRIPTLCHDKRLIPYGACRLCIVEVTARGKTRTMPACFNPARDGMEVATDTPALKASRRTQLMLLLRSHPLLCPNCDAAGDCELQNLVFEYEIPDLPFARQARYFHVDNDSNFIRFNMNLCIRCGMCVRICEEVQGQSEISFINRGMNAEVSTDFDRPLDCEFCGQCADICPVGAIASKWLVGTGRRFELSHVTTTCSICSLGCALRLEEKDQSIVYVNSPHDAPNEGSLCVKGRYGWTYAFSEGRLETPLVKKNGVLTESTWEEALTVAADGLAKVKKAHGSQAIGALGSARLTNEEAYVFNRFVKSGLGSSNIDHGGGVSHQALVDGLAEVFGYPASTNSIRELRNAKAILLIGADLTESHPVAKNEIIMASGRKRAKVIVIDSVRTKLSERDGVFIKAPLGSEATVVFSMIKVIIDEELYDKASVASKTEGFDALSESLKDYTPEKIGDSLSIDPDLIRQAARIYAQAPTAMTVLAEGLYKAVSGAENAKAAACLAALTGHIAKESCGILILGEKANSQGAVDMGLTPKHLPGFGLLEDEASRKKFETLWKTKLPASSGMDAVAILSGAADGSIKGLYVVGENPVDDYPDRALTEKAFKAAEFVVVQDLFYTSTAKMADVVLPACSAFEKEGTFTSSERRVQRLRPSTKEKLGHSDLEIFNALAGKMELAGFTYSSPKDVMKEIAKTVEAYAGVDFDSLGVDGLTWPGKDSADTGGTILYTGGFPGGKAKLPVAGSPQLATTSAGQFVMVPVVSKFHSGSMSVWSHSLMDVCPEPVAEMNSADMKTLGVDEGAVVKLTNDFGDSFKVKIKWSRRPSVGQVLVPYHFPALKLNSFVKWNEPLVKVKVEKA